MANAINCPSLIDIQTRINQPKVHINEIKTKAGWYKRIKMVLANA